MEIKMSNLILNKNTTNKDLHSLVLKMAKMTNWEMKFDRLRHWHYLVISGNFIERVAFLADGTKCNLNVVLWPANTVGQARQFYSSVSKETFFGIESLGWYIETHLTFSFRQRGEYFVCNTLVPKNYYDLVKTDQNSLIGQKRFNKNLGELTLYLENWSQKCLISSSDVENLKNIFANRTWINIRPGFQTSKSWDFGTVEELDKKGKLEHCILESVYRLLETLGESH